MVLLGGINGFFYSVIVSVLVKCDKLEVVLLIEIIIILVSGVLLLVIVSLIFFVDFLIDLVVLGLS